MTSGENRAQAIFEEAVDLSTGDRTAYIDEACGDDETLKQRVLSLLEFSSDDDDDFASVAGLSNTPDELIGTNIGKFMIKSLLGEGGFGAVYLAEQHDPVKRQVAIKIIKLGMGSKSIVARFQAERQALAHMNHPGIARIIQAGTTSSPLIFSQLDRDGDGVITPDEWQAAWDEIDVNKDGSISAAEWQSANRWGRPYFVMEYVPGESITDYCEIHSFDINERIAIFQQACAAIQHAHSRGIIHRDIKPSNVLVTSTPEGHRVKVIDFGIAKALSAKIEDATFITHEGQVVGTPEFMSPEQCLSGSRDIGTATDIYSLGVLLYELLTGHRPFDSKTLGSGNLVEIQRIICEDTPSKPSTRFRELSSERGGLQATPLDARRLNVKSHYKSLRGDLDWIIMKCLEKDPERRYLTALALSDDLDRYIDSRPVHAAAPGWQYRFKKFAKRKSGLLAACALIALALIGGIVASSYFAIEASQQRDEAIANQERAEGVTDFLTNMLSAVDPTIAKSMDNELMLMILDEAVLDMEQSLTEQPLIKAELLSTIGVTYMAIGQYSKAMPHLAESLETRRRILGDEHPDTLNSIRNMGAVLSNQGKYDEAMTYFTEVLGIERRVLGDEHLRTLGSISNMGQILRHQGKYDEAMVYLTETVEVQRRVLGDEHPNTLTAINNMGILLFSQGKYDEAMPYVTEALETRRRVLGDEHPKTLDSINDIGELLRRQGKYDEAMVYLTETVEVQRRVLGDEHPDTLGSINNMGLVSYNQGKYDEAMPYYTEALEALRRVLGDEHPKTLDLINNIGELLRRQGKYDEAMVYVTEALETRRRVLGDEHPDTLGSINNMGVLLSDQGKYDEAVPYYVETLETRRRVLGDEHPDTLIAIGNMGFLLSKQGKYDEVMPYYTEALETSRRVLGDEHPSTLTSINNMGVLLSEQGKYDEAMPYFAETLGVQRRVLGDEHPDTLLSIYNMGFLLKVQGKYDEAYQAAVECHSLNETVYGPNHQETIDVVELLIELSTQLNRPEEAQKYRSMLPAPDATADEPIDEPSLSPG